LKRVDILKSLLTEKLLVGVTNPDQHRYRQKPIGNYIVDFYCPKRKLVVEADGSQHFEKQGKEYDAERSAFLTSLGLQILRFDNYEILTNVDGVLERILEG